MFKDELEEKTRRVASVVAELAAALGLCANQIVELFSGEYMHQFCVLQRQRGALLDRSYTYWSARLAESIPTYVQSVVDHLKLRETPYSVCVDAARRADNGRHIVAVMLHTFEEANVGNDESVSYTHLTLPTICSV